MQRVRYSFYLIGGGKIYFDYDGTLDDLMDEIIESPDSWIYLDKEDTYVDATTIQAVHRQEDGPVDPWHSWKMR